jgi:hypothetical protein
MLNFLVGMNALLELRTNRIESNFGPIRIRFANYELYNSQIRKKSVKYSIRFAVRANPYFLVVLTVLGRWVAEFLCVSRRACNHLIATPQSAWYVILVVVYLDLC